MVMNLLHVQEEQATTVQGGASSAGVNTRVLNTVKTNEISGASLASNKITLPTGTYEVYAGAACYRGDAHRAWLYNVTDAGVEVYGANNYARDGGGGSAARWTTSLVRGRFTIAATKDFELRHQIDNAEATNGLGIAGNDGRTEVYSFVQIREIVSDFDLLHVRDEKTAGTDGGTSTSATWHTRALNTVKTNEISGASLSSNQITLPAGTYSVEATAKYYNGDTAQAVLYNVTESKVDAFGMVQHCRSTLGHGDLCHVSGQFIISVATVFELRHNIANGVATNGLGTNSNDGSPEVYSDVLIRKLL